MKNLSQVNLVITLTSGRYGKPDQRVKVLLLFNNDDHVHDITRLTLSVTSVTSLYLQIDLVDSCFWKVNHT